MSRHLPLPRPGLPVLRRGRDRVQIGLDPRRAVVVERLSDTASSALLHLDGGIGRHEVVRGAPELDPLLDRLHERGLLDDDPEPHAASPAYRRARHALDLRALALSSSVVDADRTLARRRRATVVVRGNDRAAALVATGLAHAGIGTVALAGPDRAVGVEDVAPAGPHEPEVGWLQEMSGVLRRLGAHPSLASSRAARPAVTVLCSAADADLPWTDPELGDDLLADGLAHLAVAVSGSCARVGPLVLPGRSACLWCLDHRARDADPAWPALADQLRLRHARARTSLGPVAAAAAAVAVAHALAVVDLGPHARPASVDAQVVIEHPDLLTVRVPLVTHPACGCGWPAQADTMDP